MSKGPLLESDIERRVAKIPGPWSSVKLHIRHWPDRAFFGYNGRTIFMEFKRPGEDQRCGQRVYSEALARAGFRVFVVDDYAVAGAILAREFGR